MPEATFNSACDIETDMTIPTRAFYGNAAAELFARECRESLDGLCTWNLVREPGELPVGFVHASPPGQGWAFTMWTRDAGVFLDFRERGTSTRTITSYSLA